MNFFQTEKYVVVNFIDELSQDDKPVVELIPSCWLIFETDGTVKQTMYQSVDDSPFVSKWIAKCRDPGLAWGCHKIKILSQVDDYNRGIRRINRAVVNPDRRLSSECTDNNEDTNNNPTVIPEENMINILNQSQQLHGQKDRTNVTVGLRNDIDNVDNAVVNMTTGGQDNKKNKINDAVHHLENLRQSINDDPLKKFIADYMDAKFMIIEENILNKISNTKQSLQYDLKASIGSVKKNAPACLGNGISPRSILKTPLPIEDPQTFLDFKTFINTSDDGTPDSITTKEMALVRKYLLIPFNFCFLLIIEVIINAYFFLRHHCLAVLLQEHQLPNEMWEL